jgi:hypothetical protein
MWEKFMGKATGGKVFANRELTAKGASAAERLTPYLDRGAKGERFGTELLIGPEEAEFLLGFNPDNRNLRPTKIAQFVKDMRHGRWQNNGESIIVASTGELNDGQHRLHAIFQSKIPQHLIVVFGVARETRSTIDIGAARTTGEHLHMSGMALGPLIAASAKLVLSYEQAGGRGVGRTSSITSLEQQERAKVDTLLQEIAHYCDKHRVPFIRPSMTVAAFYILSRVAPLEAKQFMDGVLTGLNLSADDPAYLARDRLMRSWTKTDNNTKRLTDSQVLETLFRAWNYYADGKKAQKIQVMGSLPVLKAPRPDQPASFKATQVADEVATELGDSEASIVPYEIEREPVAA